MTPSERHHVLTEIFIQVCDLQGEPRRGALERFFHVYPNLREELIELLSIHDLVTRSFPGREGPLRRNE